MVTRRKVNYFHEPLEGFRSKTTTQPTILKLLSLTRFYPALSVVNTELRMDTPLCCKRLVVSITRFYEDIPFNF